MAATAAMFVFTACDTKEPYLPEEDIDFIEVSQNGTTVFTEQDVEWRLAEQEDGTYTLYMDQTHFIQAMPMLDMEVRGLVNNYAADYADTFFKCEAASIVPYYSGREMPSYTLTKFKCEADDNYITASFTCVGYDVKYKGQRR